MSVIKTFKGFVPKADLASKVASFPYDVVSSEEAREIAKDNPYSFLHVVKPEIDLPVEVDIHDDKVYAKGAENLKNFIEKGYLVQCEKQCFYVYRQKMGNRTQTGLVAGVSVEEYDKNLIKKHEFTRKDKEEDRVKHIDILGANSGPAFLTYHHRNDIDEIISEITAKTPYADFVSDDGIGHTLWIIDDEAVCKSLQKKFSEIPAMYIADGHHRSAASARVSALRKARNPNHTGNEIYNHFMAVIFPDNQLYIMDYNRVLKDLNGLTAAQLMEKIKEIFTVTEMSVSKAEDAKPTKRTEFSMLLEGKWYRLNVKFGIVPENDPVKSLDVAVLQDNILKPVFGIDDPRTSNRIDFIGGIRGLAELERRCKLDCKVAFALYPTGMDQLMSIADAGEVMPPKSTWFEPKLRSGMVVRMLD